VILCRITLSFTRTLISYSGYWGVPLTRIVRCGERQH
jgi:hypothetical protein